MRHLNKKGDLSLSVNAIVVMVIAFVVLGLILTFTRTIFKFGQTKATEIFDVTSLDTKPTSDTPITISQKISMSKNAQKELKVGYYNRNDGSATAARFAFAGCLNEDGDEVCKANLPSIISGATTVKPSESTGYNLIIKDNGLPKGLYVCDLIVYSGDPQAGYQILGDDENCVDDAGIVLTNNPYGDCSPGDSTGDCVNLYEKMQIFYEVTS